MDANQLGPIEAAMKEAEEKVRFYSRQAITAKQEEQRWQLVKDQLSNALALATGKAKPQDLAFQNVGVPSSEKTSTDGRVFRDWKALFTQALANNPGMTRKELRNTLLKMDSTLQAANLYAAFPANINNGNIIEIDGKIYLPEQVEAQTSAEPQQQKTA